MTVTEAYAVLAIAHYFEQDTQAPDGTGARRALVTLVDAAADRLNIEPDLTAWPLHGPPPLVAGPIR